MQKFAALFVIFTFVFSDLSTILQLPLTRVAEAAVVNIDANVSANQNEHTILGTASVFISDLVGYKFYVDSDGRCVFRKTTDGGVAWGAPTLFDSQNDCGHPTIWYDKWTPGDNGDYVHIITADTNQDDVWYNRLDTTSDTLLLGTSPVSVVTGQSALAIAPGANKQSITKGTDGTLYIAVADAADSFVVECDISCNLAGSWTETGVNQMDNANDFPLLMPLDGGDIMLIVRDISTNDIEYQTWNNSAWSGSWIAIDTNAPESNVYDVGMDAVLGNNSNEIFLAYTAQNNTLGTDDDIRTAKYSSGTWTSTSDVITNDAKGIQQVTIAADENTNDVYVGYSARTTPATAGTSHAYWASSTEAMSVWGAEQQASTATGDFYGIDLNFRSNQRIYMTWEDESISDLFGETIADVSPGTAAFVEGSQISEIRASTTGQYIGGQFAIVEFVGSRNVTSIQITENGSVDAANGLNNIKLLYDFDTSAPHDCVSESYDGAETQFGATDTNGFSGADGTSSFTDSVSISPTQAMCVYVELDVLNTAADLSNLEIEIENPATDILVSGGEIVTPESPLLISGTTNIVNSELTQSHFHWRNDDGSEAGATSATAGSEDVDLTALQQGVPRRLRFAVSNEGSTSTNPTSLQLQYALNTSTCDALTAWTAVGDTDDDWNMFDSAFVTEATDTTDIAVSSGGVTNENTVFLSSNGGVRDTSDSTAALTFLPTNWTEVEFSVIASTSAAEGNTYCFRLSDSGVDLPTYTVYPKATIAADIEVTSLGTQATTVSIPTTGFNIGGSFVLQENTSSRNITGITITETGTVDATSGVSNVELFYDLDTTAPYDCVSESYSGTEAQFGLASTSFSAPNGIAEFTDSVFVSTTQSMCVYVVMDITASAENQETLDISINSASTDVVVSGGGTVSPLTAVDITASTTLVGAIVTQSHYHWRNDDGPEAGATSATGGVEDTPLLDFGKSQAIRLRVALSNEGSADSVEHRYGLEYGIKTTSCDLVSVWTDVDGGGVSWSMFDSPNVADGEDTTNIAEATGGVTDENTTFLTPNAGVIESESFSASTTIASTEFVEFEYGIQTTAETPYETDFCFRVTRNGLPLLQYNAYPEVSVEPKRDFKIQRGGEVVSGTGVTLTAGVDYVAPAATENAFVRITNAHYTGAGKDTLGGNQNARDYGAYILDPGNLATSFTISRDIGSINNTFVNWEIVEYIGPAGGDNEFFVRDQDVVTMASGVNTATGPAATGVADDNDVVVFVTGQMHNGANRTEAFAHQFTSDWLAGTDEPEFTRGADGANQGKVSYAVVEFVGLNWKIQRVEHAYLTTDIETESITAVNSPSRTFLHTQKRYGAGSSGQDDFGHLVWLSSIGAVSFDLPATANLPSGHVSVAWVVENVQTTGGEMFVQRSSGNTIGGSEPLTISVSISTAVNATNNASIFTNVVHDQANNRFPRVMAGAEITAVSNYNLWRSDTGGTLTYRTEIVQWPAADLAIRQNYYRLYADNDALTPTDAWPAGAADLGENTPVGVLDEPLADTDNIRIRMTTRIVNATLPSGFVQMKLQYALRTTTCSAETVWTDVGGVGSGEIWRAYNAPSVTDGVSISGNPPTSGELLISISDRSGRYTEANPATANQYAVLEGEDVEYDWNIEQNGATQRSTYCFRMVKSDDTELDSYIYYPEIRTEGFTPVVDEWRWYRDAASVTPTTPAAAEGSAPVEVLIDEAFKLRVTVDEIKNLSQSNARFKLQFAQNADFSDVVDVVSTTTCLATSEWCYFDGGGNDHENISEAVLSGSDACTGGAGIGCGTHNESSIYITGKDHGAGQSKEYEFSVQYKNTEIKYGQVYYFRLFDTANNELVQASTTYPSATTETTKLVFSVNGLEAGTTTAGVVTTATSTATAVDFGTIPIGVDQVMAQRISVFSNGSEGYQIFKYADQQLVSSYATEISPITGTNAAPTSWAVGCVVSAVSCFGYHTTDATLENTSARFAPTDSYAALDTGLDEIMYSSVPSTDIEDIIYRIRVNDEQPAGVYETGITYIAVPVF